MQNSKKILVLFIAIFVLCVSACSGGSPLEVNELHVNKPQAENEAADEADPRESAMDSLPDNLDFGGEKIRILNRAPSVSYTTAFFSEIEGEIDSGDIVVDAIYRRNRSVEDRLNIEIISIEIPGGWDEQDVFLRAIKNSVASGGDDYDFIAAYSYYITPIATEGTLYNLKNLNYLSPEQIWWSADCANEMMIDGKLYFIAGDLAISLLKNMYVTFFNKQLAQDLNVENMYQMVLNGDFTVDKLKELTKDTWRDLNGDGIADKGDAFGYAVTMGTYLDAMFATLDNPITVKNQDGIPELALNTPKTVQ